jgi:hypothetical protein
VGPGSLSLTGMEVRCAPIGIGNLAGMVHHITGKSPRTVRLTRSSR